jgi:hypothetical protein
VRKASDQAAGYTVLDTDKWAMASFSFSRFSHTQTLKSKMVIFLLSKFLKILQVDCLKHGEQLFFLDDLQNSKDCKL